MWNLAISYFSMWESVFITFRISKFDLVSRNLTFPVINIAFFSLLCKYKILIFYFFHYYDFLRCKFDLFYNYDDFDIIKMFIP